MVGEGSFDIIGSWAWFFFNFPKSLASRHTDCSFALLMLEIVVSHPCNVFGNEVCPFGLSHAAPFPRGFRLGVIIADGFCANVIFSDSRIAIME